MLRVIETEPYQRWVESLNDPKTKARILTRVQRLILGNPGDVSPIGDGASELRLDFGPGYRIYHVQHGDALIVLLGGGSKKGQNRDIAKALALWREIKGEVE